MTTIMRGVLAAALLLPGAAQAKVRAVFVGIDKYENSRARLPTAGFDDLSGAVSDTRNIRDAVARAYRLDVGSMADDSMCQTGSAATTTTLINKCATKAEILAAWKRTLAESQPGDTLLLYFAGHGSRFIDDAALDQASKYNSTLMAQDARRPGALAGADIRDSEVREFIDLATSNGVNVVTWFDSCNSGTASRDGNSATRTAPDLRVSGLQPIASPQKYGVLGAYRVHIGAAGDGQDAKEVGSVGQRAGVFTTALAKAIIAAPQASFADIAARVVDDVTRATNGRQLPHAEGALRAAMGEPEIKVAIFDVNVEGGQLVIEGGSLIGVTQYSRFELFASTGDALAGNSGITARVTSVTPGAATLIADAPLPPGTPGRLAAREIAHDFGGPVIALAVDDPGARAAAQRLDFVRLDPAGRFALRASGGRLSLTGPTGLLATLPSSASADFGVRLAAALEKVARVERWLAAVQPRDGVTLCVQNIQSADDDYRLRDCPALPASGLTLKMGLPITVSVENQAAAPRHVTVLAIGSKYGVTRLLPGFGGKNDALAKDQILFLPEGQAAQAGEIGPIRFVALSSAGRLNSEVLEQTDTDVVDVKACLSPVARAFCRDKDQARDAVPAVGDWSVAVVGALVKD